MVVDKYFYLHELEDSILDDILNLDHVELEEYILSLINNYYPNCGDTRTKELIKAYKASFLLEKVYRSSDMLIDNFTAVYTKTGLIRELVNDLYSITAIKLSVN